MATYTILFEVFDKKMKTSISAKNENEAKQKLLSKIKFHKVTKCDDDFIESLKSIFKL